MNTEATAKKVSELTAEDVMNPDVISVPDDMPIGRLAGFLISHGISGAPVTDQDEVLIGVVSLTDIVRHDGLPNKRIPRSGSHDYYLSTDPSGLRDQYSDEDMKSFRIDTSDDVTARDIMTPTIFNVLPDTPIQEVADHMIRGRIHRQFVTSGDRVVGIITALDLLKVVRNL
jgi:CBS domain-containing protein